MGRQSALQSSGARQSDPGADDAALELLDVPAAVVCANCGHPDCPGCLHDEGSSAVIAIIPWERPGQRWPARLLTTARLATTSSESFFGALPDGALMPALRFAVVAELLALSGLVLFALPFAFALVPGLPRALTEDLALRQAAVRAVGIGIPSVALAMVAVHAAHGLGLDWGARRYGSQRRGRGLRFGLYACGWDLLTLPIALLLSAIAEGPRAALTTAALGISVPSRGAGAYLRGIHALAEDEATRASRFAAWIVAALVAAAICGVLLAMLLI
jgi:hypothetical protein